MNSWINKAEARSALGSNIAAYAVLRLKSEHAEGSMRNQKISAANAWKYRCRCAVRALSAGCRCVVDAWSSVVDALALRWHCVVDTLSTSYQRPSYDSNTNNATVANSSSAKQTLSLRSGSLYAKRTPTGTNSKLPIAIGRPTIQLACPAQA